MASQGAASLQIWVSDGRPEQLAEFFRKVVEPLLAVTLVLQAEIQREGGGHVQKHAGGEACIERAQDTRIDAGLEELGGALDHQRE